MRILQINKFFYPRGGAEQVFFDTIALLRARGHDISEFSMTHPRNLPSEYAAYFASELPELLHNQRALTEWRIFSRLFYSREITRKLTALIIAAEPEVAHLHNVYHHLSAATFLTLARQGIPLVLTLHDVFPLCPNHSLLKGETMGDEYFKGKLYNCVRYRCINNEFWPSVAGTLEAYYYRYRRVWARIARFICPSDFMRNKMIEYGFPAAKMRVVPNPFRGTLAAPPLGNTVLYLGRLHAVKGVKIFLEALRYWRGVPARVAGTGPLAGWVEDYRKQYSLTDLELLGWVDSGKKSRAYTEARVVVVPSLFYENCSLTILEAIAAGRLVVAVDRGGNREIIEDGVTGFLAAPEDPEDLARAIRRAYELPPAEAEAMIARAQQRLVERHNPGQYIAALEEVYQEATQLVKN
ncbi:MAG: glycosyltransferase [Candidatus Magasanikbacteria bacterium]|nr:glycosyltransferase [Candidatus Magasanikbacteria bacterium]